jgi:hypothetical protein
MCVCVCVGKGDKKLICELRGPVRAYRVDQTQRRRGEGVSVCVCMCVCMCVRCTCVLGTACSSSAGNSQHVGVGGQQVEDCS